MNIKNRIRNISMNDFWRKLAKNVTTVLVGNGGSSIINFFVTIIMVRVLGNTDYGIFLISLQYMNLVDGIVNFQSWVGVIKYGSEAIVEKNEPKLAAIFKQGFKIDFITAILGCIIAWLILPVAGTIMKWTELQIILAAIFSIEIVFHIEGTSLGILRLFDKFNMTASQSIVSALLKFILLGIYMLRGGKSLITVVILYVITDIFKHLYLFILAIIVLRKKIGLKNVLTASTKQLDRKFISYTIWNNISYTVDVPVKYFDVFIISQISVEMVAVYKVFKQMIQVLSMLIQPISVAILPQFSELLALGKGEEAYKKVYKIRNVILSLGAVGVVVSLLVGKQLFNIFLGTEYGNNIFLFEILLVMQVVLLSYVSVHPFFSSLGMARKDFEITVVSNLVYIVIAFALVSQMGIYAVIIATAVQGLLCIYGKLFLAKRFINYESKN
jgi:O-antigen/teichoic acid export membrane protein